MQHKLTATVIFGIAFGLVEAAVAYYLRTMFNFQTNYAPEPGIKVAVNLGVIAFLSPGSQIFPSVAVAKVEMIRELSTIVMLAAVAILAGENLRQKLAAFLVVFATWDIFYYLFLRVFTGWPASFLNIDVYFLNPVPWVGPVVTPVVISLLMFAAGIRLYGRLPKS